MLRFTREELTRLAVRRPESVASVYVPLARSSPDSRQNVVRVRDALDQARDKLREAEVEPKEVDRLIELGREQVVPGSVPGSNGSLGLALLMEPGRVHAWELPFACEELVHVGQRFQIVSLARLLQEPTSFLLAAVSGHAVRLWECDSATATELNLPSSMPRSLDDFQRPVETGDAVKFQAGVGRGSGGANVVIHGGTSAKDAAHDRRREFVQTVARSLGAWEGARRMPLVLACVGEFQAVFREAYPGDNLLEAGLHGSPDDKDLVEMRTRAAELIRPDQIGESKRLLARFHSTTRPDLSIFDPRRIVEAARERRVDVLIASAQDRIWAHRDDASGVAVPTGKPQPATGDVDLVNEALAETLLHRGDVCVVAREFVPDRTPMAAILRWST